MTTTEKTTYRPEGVITPLEAKERLGFVHWQSLNKLVAEGRIQAFQIGRKRWIVESSVETELKRKRSGHGSKNEIC